MLMCLKKIMIIIPGSVPRTDTHIEKGSGNDTVVVASINGKR